MVCIGLIVESTQALSQRRGRGQGGNNLISNCCGAEHGSESPATTKRGYRKSGKLMQQAEWSASSAVNKACGIATLRAQPLQELGQLSNPLSVLSPLLPAPCSLASFSS